MTTLIVAVAAAILAQAPTTTTRPATMPVLVVFETERGAITMEIRVVRAYRK